MIQMLDPPGVWGLSRRGLHFLLKNRRNKRKEKKGGIFNHKTQKLERAWSRLYQRKFQHQKCHFVKKDEDRSRPHRRQSWQWIKTEKWETKKFEQGQFNTTSSPASPARQLASKAASQKTGKPTASKQPAAHHHNTATQQANHPADQPAETSQPKASSSNHSN